MEHISQPNYLKSQSCFKKKLQKAYILCNQLLFFIDENDNYQIRNIWYSRLLKNSFDKISSYFYAFVHFETNDKIKIKIKSLTPCKNKQKQKY